MIWTYLKSWLFPTESETNVNIHYPKRPPRYFSFGWNQNSQYCYTPADIKLIQAIYEKYKVIADKTGEKNPFELITEKQFYDWWVCHKPAINLPLDESFTLPNRDAKDLITFPLWNFADDLAGQIANWQGDRLKDQSVDLMNDPVMIIFDELKAWLLDSLAEKGCRKEVLEYISMRQSYVKELLHLLHKVPDFGPDRLHLHEIQSRLEIATSIIDNCIANKQLPDLLSDVIIKGKSLEMTLGSYLHFLVGEPVTHNFAREFTEANPSNCKSSPICKAYQNVEPAESSTDAALSPYQQVNRFYQLSKNAGLNDETTIHIQFKPHALNNINFADFITPKEKQDYLSALATLESLIQVRKTLENFKSVQSSIGTYVFARNYLETTNTLATNYINLIDKAQVLTNELLGVADRGLKLILQRPDSKSKPNMYFEKNLRALDTQFAKGTTTRKQLDHYCVNAKESMHAYQEEMKKLSASLQSGAALHEVEEAMEKLVLQINQINSFIAAQLGKQALKLPRPEGNRRADKKNDGANSPNTSRKLAAFEISLENDDVAESKQDETNILATLSNANNSESTAWKTQITLDPLTQHKIFTYILFQNDTEVGSIQFYHLPWVCFSKDLSQNNILSRTGIFKSIDLESYQSIAPTCEVLPPTLFDRVLISSAHGAAHGALRGTTNVIEKAMQTRFSNNVAYFTSQFSYYLPLFLLSFYNSVPKTAEENSFENVLYHLYEAAFSTANIWLTNNLISNFTRQLNLLSHDLQERNWPRLSQGLATSSKLMRFGIFALQAKENGIAATSSTYVAGATAQVAMEKTGDFIASRMR